MKNENMLCSEMECAPPFGDKKDCEFYEDGYCIGAIRPDKDAIRQVEDILHRFNITINPPRENCAKVPRRGRNGRNRNKML